MRISVHTLDQQMLEEATAKLQASCNGFTPDLVIGIANGGAHVANLMFAQKEHAHIQFQRPSTKIKKNRFMRFAVKVLPYPILDWMRIIESTMSFRHKPKPTSNDLVLNEQIKEQISKAKNILIVDDAVDSGITLDTVLKAISQLKNEHSTIKTAVLTVTKSNPLVMPDYYLYNNHTLIRFPWSMDMKK